MTDLIVPHRFCGPPDSGNGGWTAGALAAALSTAAGFRAGDHAHGWSTIEVSLRQPPPLDTPLAVTTDAVTADAETATASFGGAVIATARRATEVHLTEVEGVSPATARAAEATYAGHAFHPFPTCFACGTGRAEGDGLRIFPGPVDGDRVAATWTPHPSVGEDHPAYDDGVPRASLPATWAALDCVGGWAGDLTERLMVLGRMTTRVDALPAIGEEHVVVGAGRRREGRKTFTAATLHDSDGRVVATAEHIWIAVDPALFGGKRPSD